jgi:hypothetical protein
LEVGGDFKVDQLNPLWHHPEHPEQRFPAFQLAAIFSLLASSYDYQLQPASSRMKN